MVFVGCSNSIHLPTTTIRRRRRERAEEMSAEPAGQQEVQHTGHETDAPSLSQSDMAGETTAKDSRDEKRKDSGPPAPASLTEPAALSKSLSSSDLAERECEAAGSRQPTQPAAHRSQRPSITEMVAECVLNPGSMAHIRRQLKADNLTPRIQRKFHCKTTPTNLPALSTETSPLARDSHRAKGVEPQRLAPPPASDCKTTPNPT